MPKPRVYAPVAIPVAAEGAGSIGRADIVVAGLDLAGPSYELRIFLNNPDANPDTDPAPATGYAGSIYVYGYGQPPREADAPHTPPRLPMRRYIMATEAVRAAAASGATATVTLVPIPSAAPGVDIDLSDVEVSVVLSE